MKLANKVILDINEIENIGSLIKTLLNHIDTIEDEAIAIRGELSNAGIVDLGDSKSAKFMSDLDDTIVKLRAQLQLDIKNTFKEQA